MSEQGQQAPGMNVTNTASRLHQRQSTVPHFPQRSVDDVPKQAAVRRTIYDRHLNRGRTAELSRASFAYLFSEMIIYAQRRVTGIADLEKR